MEDRIARIFSSGQIKKDNEDLINPFKSIVCLRKNLLLQFN